MVQQNKKDHRFKKVWNKKKKEKPNRERYYPTLSFRTNNLQPETINYLLNAKERGEMSEEICKAIEQRIFTKQRSNLFINNLVHEYYDEIKKILRKIGRERTQYKAKENNRNIYKHE